jgi:hypothetical protein
VILRKSLEGILLSMYLVLLYLGDPFQHRIARSRSFCRAVWAVAALLTGSGAPRALGRSGVGLEEPRAASFAAVSAFSFPRTPVCPGTHMTSHCRLLLVFWTCL